MTLKNTFKIFLKKIKEKFYTKIEVRDIVENSVELNKVEIDSIFDNVYNTQSMNGNFENNTFVVENAIVEETTLII